MGRFPTCSSPVRHGYPRRDPVRLACIRHAASVNPEPGSNSPPTLLCLPGPKTSAGLCSSRCVRHLAHPHRIFPPCRPPKGPAGHSGASVLHLRPPGRQYSSASLRFPGGPSALSGNQPVKVLALKINASDKRKPSLAGRVTPGFDTVASRHRSSSTIYKAKPPGLSSALISARVSNC